MPIIHNFGLTPIHTSYDPKPGPLHLAQRFDWEATFDPYDECGLLGYGPTERDAIIDLLDQYHERQEEECYLQTNSTSGTNQDRAA